MRAISNTSPISNLAAIGRLKLLNSQFDSVSIPTAVARELKAHPVAAAADLIQTALTEKRIEILQSNPSHLLSVLLTQLHQGEAEAIALAAATKADFLLIDEREGRRLAIQAGLSVTGVLGILLRAKFKGDIAALRPEIEALRSKARFFIAADLEHKVLFAAGEI
jgi:predicted nucleic acid-binding protein